jgi:exonuclease III
MLFLSLNIRGIGGALKLASVRRVLDKTRPEIVLFQETMVLAGKARDFMFKLQTKLALLCSKL